MDASVIVPARNAAATIGRTLGALAAQDFDGEWELIVVDDGSTDETPAIVAAEANVKLIRTEALGPGNARNAGAASASGRLLAFTDADCFPAPGWLRAGVRALERADLVQGAAHPDRSNPPKPWDHTIWITGESALYETASLFVKRELFDRVGGFEDWLDVTIGKRLGEDVWFGWKARRAGARTTFAADACVEHAVFPRSAAAFVLERRRLVYFPELVAKMPELRRELLWGDLFLSARTAAFDLALAGVLAARLSKRRGRVLSALAFAPYAAAIAGRHRRLGEGATVVTLADIAADCVGFVALARGSWRARTPVL